MKKINSRIVVVVFVFLTLLVGGLSAKQAIAPSGFGQGDAGTGGGG